MRILQILGVVCVILIGGAEIKAQQLPLFTQYREYQAVLNPGGISHNYFNKYYNFNAGVSYRNQWTKLDGSPRNLLATTEWINSKQKGSNLVFGANLFDFSTAPISLSAAYLRCGVILGPKDASQGGISAGLNLGIQQYSVDFGAFKYRQPFDPVQSLGQYVQIVPDVGVGVFAYKRLQIDRFKGDVVYFGFSIPQIIGLSNVYDQNNSNRLKYHPDPHYYLQAGMYKYTSDDFFWEPSIWLKCTSAAPIHVNLNLRAYWNKMLWLGAGFTASNFRSIHLETGITLLEWFHGDDSMVKIGYGYDLRMGPYRNLFGASHEINISFSMSTEKPR